MKAACPFCGGTRRVAFRSKDYNRSISQDEFEYSRCERCGTYCLDDAPADLGRYYPADYYALPRNRDEADRSLDGERYKLAMIRRHAAGGRLLEIGPGAGMFAHLAATSGYAVETIEMSARSAGFIQDVLGITTHRTDDEVETLSRCGPFDAIAMWHVLEHLRDPVALLGAAAKALRSGGILVLATPNPASLQFRLLGARWAHLDAPRHLFLIAAGALRDAAAKLGLDEIEFTTADEGTLYWNRFGWDVSLKHLGAAGLVTRVVRRLMRPLERIPGLGSAYTMILRRR